MAMTDSESEASPGLDRLQDSNPIQVRVPRYHEVGSRSPERSPSISGVEAQTEGFHHLQFPSF